MIKKKITMSDGKKYIVGFKTIGSEGEGIECHILKKILFLHISIYKKLTLAGMMPNYHEMAMWTIIDYEKVYNQTQALLEESWD